MRKLSTGARCGRWVLMAALALSAGLASGRAVPSPPASEWADAEASTNVPLAVSAADLAELRVRIDLAAGPTNVVTVAVGFDSDGDGALSPSEEGWRSAATAARGSPAVRTGRSWNSARPRPGGAGGSSPCPSPEAPRTGISSASCATGRVRRGSPSRSTASGAACASSSVRGPLIVRERRNTRSTRKRGGFSTTECTEAA